MVGEEKKQLSEEEKTLSNEQTYDSSLAAMVTRLPKYIAPLVNELFDEKFSPNAQVTIRNSKHIVSIPDGSLRRRDTDAFIELSELINEMVRKQYHFECETWYESTVVIRIAEYNSSIAVENAELTAQGLILRHPNSAVIFLRPGLNIPKSMKIIHQGPNGDEMSYDVPAIQIRDYTVDDIFSKELLILLPFYLFRYADELRVIDQDEKKRNLIERELIDINLRLEKMAAEKKINAYQKRVTQELMKRVSEKLTIKFENIREGVERIMSGYIARTSADEILEQGIEQGIDRGIDQGSENATRVINYLWENGRGEDAKRAERDPEYRRQLMAEISFPYEGKAKGK